MADKLAVLGEASTLTVGTHTIYSVSTNKSAKGYFFYRILLANTGTFKLTVNGIDVMEDTAAGAEVAFSSPNALYESNAGTPTGVDGDTTVGISPRPYILSAGDLVSYTVGVVALTSGNLQFVGVELDA